MTESKDNMYYSRQFLNLPSKTSPASIRTEIINMLRYTIEFRDCSSMVHLHGSLSDFDEQDSYDNFVFKCTMIVEEVTKLMEFAKKRHAELKGKKKRGYKKKQEVRIYDGNTACYETKKYVQD